MNRRRFLQNSLLGCSTLGSLPHLPAIVASPKARPRITHGFQSGDITRQSAVIWSRSNQPSRMVVEFFADFENRIKIGEARGTVALADNDYCSKAYAEGLPAGKTVHYRVQFQSLSDLKVFSEPAHGILSTPGDVPKDISFCWSGDTAGQGWGIDETRGGMRSYAAMAALKPDCLVHCGDIIYADNPMSAEVTLDDGSIWKNTLIEAKTRVAESTQDFRDNFKYNLMDKNVRDFHATVPVYVQWDDHEVTNNWYPTKVLNGSPLYVDGQPVDELYTNSLQAFYEFNPIEDGQLIYRAQRFGKHVEIFFPDLP